MSVYNKKQSDPPPNEAKPILGWSKYWALPSGEVFSERSGRILKPAINGHGYLSATFIDDEGNRKPVRIHREICKAFHGDSSEMTVNHKNGIKTDNRPENLEWMTSRENHLHALKMGMTASGEKSHFCKKLTASKAEEIRKITGRSQRDIAREYNIDQKLVSMIRSGKRWKYSSPTKSPKEAAEQ